MNKTKIFNIQKQVSTKKKWGWKKKAFLGTVISCAIFALPKFLKFLSTLPILLTSVATAVVGTAQAVSEMVILAAGIISWIAKNWLGILLFLIVVAGTFAGASYWHKKRGGGGSFYPSIISTNIATVEEARPTNDLFSEFKRLERQKDNYKLMNDELELNKITKLTEKLNAFDVQSNNNQWKTTLKKEVETKVSKYKTNYLEENGDTSKSQSEWNILANSEEKFLDYLADKQNDEEKQALNDVYSSIMKKQEWDEEKAGKKIKELIAKKENSLFSKIDGWFQGAKKWIAQQLIATGFATKQLKVEGISDVSFGTLAICLLAVAILSLAVIAQTTA